MKTLSIFAVALTGFSATIASAEPNTVARPEAAVAASAPAKARADTRSYCIVETPTGSRLPVKQCQTRAQWALEGVEVGAPTR